MGKAISSANAKPLSMKRTLMHDMMGMSITCYSTRILDILNQRAKVLSTRGLLYRKLSINPTLMSFMCLGQAHNREAGINIKFYK